LISFKTCNYFPHHQMAVTVSSTLHDLLLSTSTGDPQADGVEVYKSTSFSCYNSSHRLTLLGNYTSFYITKIIKRSG